jgi:hypothetical protein
MNPIGSAGSLANQKYEINKHIQRHLQVVSKTPPSHETTRWRGGTPAKPIGSSFTRGKSAVYEMHTRNEALSNRLYTIMHENREARSYEYAPGWRAGLGKHTITYWTGVINITLSISFACRWGRYRLLPKPPAYRDQEQI